MATRNRTSVFMRYRDGVRSHRKGGGAGGAFDPSDVRRSIMQHNLLDGDALERGLGGSPGLPPAWVDIVDEANQEMAKVKSKIAELQRTHQSHLKKVFGEEDAEQTIEIMTSEISRLFHSCEKKIKTISRAGGGMGVDSLEGAPAQDKASIQAETLRKNVTRQLAGELSALSQGFRRTQQEYLKKLKAQQTNLPSYVEDDQALSVDDIGYVDKGFNDAQMLTVENTNAVISEREREIIQIARSINDLATVFKELSTLVIDQGTLLDRIDFNVEQMVESTDAGHRELIKANEHQKSARMKLLIILLVVICILLACVLFFKKVIFKK